MIEINDDNSQTLILGEMALDLPPGTQWTLNLIDGVWMVGGPGRTSKPVNQLMKLKRVRQLLASTLVFYRVNWSVGFEKNHGFFWLVEGPNLGLLGTPKNP